MQFKDRISRLPDEIRLALADHAEQHLNLKKAELQLRLSSKASEASIATRFVVEHIASKVVEDQDQAARWAAIQSGTFDESTYQSAALPATPTADALDIFHETSFSKEAIVAALANFLKPDPKPSSSPPSSTNL